MSALLQLLRLFRELDLFRKLPETARSPTELPAERGASAVLRVLSAALIGVLALSETWSFLTPVRKQRFALDMGESLDVPTQSKLRVLLDVTIKDFPCIDMSLDYQDVMGTHAVDVRSTIFKERLHKNGTAVLHTRAERNDPKAAVSAGPAHPSIYKGKGNKTCGTCYGALPEGECCNTCSDVLYAYRLKRWALPRIEDIEQCKHDGSSSLSSVPYQPPQIIRLDEYSSDDYLPKFKKLGSLKAADNEPRITTPFRLNLSFESMTKSYGSGSLLSPLVLNFSDWGPPSGAGYPSSGDANRYGSLNFEDLDDDLPGEFLGEAPAAGWRSPSSRKARAGNGTSPSPAPQRWPECVQRNVIIHGFDVGEALMVDLSRHGAKAGCWNNDCTETDKFDCDSLEWCARVCSQVDSCQWWTWGDEDGAKKCWIRSGRHGREKRYGFSSGPRSCSESAGNGSIVVDNATASSGTSPADKAVPSSDRRRASDSKAAPMAAEEVVSKTTVAGKTASRSDAPDSKGNGPRRLSSWDDMDYPSGRPYAMSFGPSPYLPVFGMNSKENDLRRVQKGESCRIYGYFDTNKVPGNFHIGAHAPLAPSYLSYYDEPSPAQQNMEHVINRLAFVEPVTNRTLKPSDSLDGFESPRAFTFQYYITINPATVVGAATGAEEEGYQFRAASFVTNELIGPAVFFRFYIDPIRVTYYTEEVSWSRFLVNLCAVVGGSIALCSMLAQALEAGSSLRSGREGG